AYQYFGTDDLYLPTLTRLLKPGGHRRRRGAGAAGGDRRDRTAGAPEAVLGAGLLVLPLPRLVAPALDPQRGGVRDGRRLAAGRLARLAAVVRRGRRGERRRLPRADEPGERADAARRRGPHAGLRPRGGPPPLNRTRPDTERGAHRPDRCTPRRASGGPAAVRRPASPGSVP